MKKLVLALTILGSTYISAEAQDLQGIYNSLSHVSSVYSDPNARPVKKAVAQAPKKRRRKVKPPEVQQNFKVCMGNTGYFICDERPVDSNSTHPLLARKINKVRFAYDDLYDMDVDPRMIPKVHMAPQQQSYPHKMGQVSPSSYVILYPKVGVIKAGQPHKPQGNSHFAYEKIPRAQYDGPQKNEERNENANSPTESLAPGTRRSE